MWPAANASRDRPSTTCAPPATAVRTASGPISRGIASRPTTTGPARLIGAHLARSRWDTARGRPAARPGKPSRRRTRAAGSTGVPVRSWSCVPRRPARPSRSCRRRGSAGPRRRPAAPRARAASGTARGSARRSGPRRAGRSARRSRRAGCRRWRSPRVPCRPSVHDLPGQVLRRVAGRRPGRQPEPVDLEGVAVVHRSMGERVPAARRGEDLGPERRAQLERARQVVVVDVRLEHVRHAPAARLRRGHHAPGVARRIDDDGVPPGRRSGTRRCRARGSGSARTSMGLAMVDPCDAQPEQRRSRSRSRRRARTGAPRRRASPARRSRDPPRPARRGSAAPRASSTGRRACRRSAARRPAAPPSAAPRRRRSRRRTTGPRARPWRASMSAPTPRRADRGTGRPPRRPEQHRQDGQVARQLDDRGDVAGRRRVGIAGRDDLGGVVDRQAGPHPECRVAEPHQPPEHRQSQHADQPEERDRRHGVGRLPVAGADDRRQREDRRVAADRHADRDQRRQRRDEPEPPRQPRPQQQGCRDGQRRSRATLPAPVARSWPRVSRAPSRVIPMRSA